MKAPAHIKVTDEGRRCSDIVRLHILAGKARSWAAIRLSDGGSDGIAYDTAHAAMHHQLHVTLCAYVQIPLDDMSPQAATRFLQLMRESYDRGYRPDRDRPDLRPIMPNRRY